MFRRKQVIVVGSVVVLMGILLSLDIKGLVKDTEGNKGNAAQPVQNQVNVDAASASAKQRINAALVKEIAELEQKLKSADEDERKQLLEQLATKWHDVDQPAPAAFYYQQLAEKENTKKWWLQAGNDFSAAYEREADSTRVPVYVQKAIYAYKKAVELDANDLEAKTGLGSAYVNEGQNPMQGIQMLLEVVKANPDHVKANMQLGLFSMKSGQYDKAVTRFQTVVKQKPNPEAYFYLASSFENLGLKADAIAAYSRSKELAADPGLAQFVDRKIEELKK